VRFPVLTAESKKMIAFWDIDPCSLVGIDDDSEERTASIIRVMIRHPDDKEITHVVPMVSLAKDFM
jgi:hypothetical protein